MIDGKYVRKILMREAENLLPTIGPGMDKKVLASIEALKNGVKETIISSGFVDDPVVNALNHTFGTVITIE